MTYRKVGRKKVDYRSVRYNHPASTSVRPSVRSQLLKLAVIHVPVSDSFVNYCILNVSISSRPGNYQTPFFIDEALLRSKL